MLSERLKIETDALFAYSHGLIDSTTFEGVEKCRLFEHNSPQVSEWRIYEIAGQEWQVAGSVLSRAGPALIRAGGDLPLCSAT